MEELKTYRVFLENADEIGRWLDGNFKNKTEARKEISQYLSLRGLKNAKISKIVEL